MKWILIVLTLWRTDVQVSEVRLEFDTEQECLDQMYELEERFVRQRSDDYIYIVSCVDQEFLEAQD